MHEQAYPKAGAVVAIGRPDRPGPRPLRRAVVAGPAVQDPFTGHLWIPVQLSRQVALVVNARNLVDVAEPPRSA